eukprot:2876486-Amphidinium_carterae.1
MESLCQWFRSSNPLLTQLWQNFFEPRQQSDRGCLVQLLDQSTGLWSARLYQMLESLRYTLLPAARDITRAELLPTHSGESKPNLMGMLELADVPNSHFVISLGAGASGSDPTNVRTGGVLME